MPNYVSCHISFRKGYAQFAADHIHTVYEIDPKSGKPAPAHAEGENLDFNVLVPMPVSDPKSPASDTHCDIPGYDIDWYNWSVDNWGTKWNASEIAYIPGTNDTGSVHFQTAWAAPDPWLDALARKYPDADFTLDFADEDGGGSNWGRLAGKNGSVRPVRSAKKYDVYAATWGEEYAKEILAED